MTFVTSKKFPDWKGNLLIGSLKFNYIKRCVIKNNKVVSQETSPTAHREAETAKAHRG